MTRSSTFRSTLRWVLCLFVTLQWMTAAAAFAPPCSPLVLSSRRHASHLSMGGGFLDSLFDKDKKKNKDNNNKPHRVYQGMTKQEEAIRKKNTYQGPRITIRQDEDAAMWVDDKQPQQQNKKRGGFWK